MNLQQFQVIVTNISKSFVYPSRQGMDAFHAIFCWFGQKCMLVSLFLVWSKSLKMHQQEISSIGHGVRILLCAPVHRHSPIFQVALTYDTNVDCQIQSFCYKLFLCYADTHTPTAKNVIFEGLQSVQFYRNLHFKNLTQKQYFLYHIWIRENKKAHFSTVFIIQKYMHINTFRRSICRQSDSD